MSLRDDVLAFIAANPGLTTREIAEAMDLTYPQVKCAINALRERRPKVLRICGWKRSLGTRGRCKPRYEASDKKDTREPPADKIANGKRYRQKNAAVLRLRQFKRRGRPITPFNIVRLGK